MDNFTPEQIEQFLEQFFDVVGRRQYIGARYVPIFGRKDESTIDWDNTKPYEPLTIVLYQGNSFTSRTYVPTGIAITDTSYWANTGNYNAQIEAYRQEVQNVVTELGAVSNKADSAFDKANSALDGVQLLDTKIDNTATTLDAKIDNTATTLDTKIDNTATTLDTKIDNTAYAINRLAGFNNTVNMAEALFRVSCLSSAGFQGGCIAEINNTKFVIIYEQDTTPTNSKLTAYLTDGTVVNSIQVDAKHGNNVCYKNNIIYIAEGDTNVVHRVSFDGSVFTLISSITFQNLSTSWRFYIDNDSNYLIWNGSDLCQVYSPDDLATPIRSIPNPDMYGYSGSNGFAFDAANNILYTLFSAPSSLVVMQDYSTGNIIGSFAFANSIGYVLVNEVEWIYVNDYDIYFGTNPSQNYPNTWASSLYTVMHTNLKRPVGMSSTARYYRLYTGSNLDITYDENATYSLPSFEHHCTVNNVTDLIGLIEMAKAVGVRANVFLHSNMSELLALPQDSNVFMEVYDYTMKGIYAVSSKITLIACRRGFFTNPNTWTGNYFIGIRSCDLYINVESMPSGYAPNKAFINAAASSVYCNNQTLLNLSNNVFDYSFKSVV